MKEMICIDPEGQQIKRAAPNLMEGFGLEEWLYR